mmetsp:Transcript_13170/g.13222  ORF Transcript_13170/g.13222 Transcript_13170/m.13222 type:complete len:220 (+) Transcript_13170:60-719(+)
MSIVRGMNWCVKQLGGSVGMATKLRFCSRMMSTSGGSPSSSPFVLFLTGPDRTGIVAGMTKKVSEHGGNVEASRMTRLAGDFSLIALMTLEKEKLPGLTDALKAELPDFIINTRSVERSVAEAEKAAESGAKLTKYELTLDGPDSVGIIASTTEALARSGVSIMDMETELSTAPFAGFPLFSLQASFKTDSSSLSRLREKMKAVEERFGLTISITEASS